MENSKHSTKEQLASIASLYNSGQSVNDNSKIIGFAEQTQNWIKRFKDGCANEIPEDRKRSGRPNMITRQTLNLN